MSELAEEQELRDLFERFGRVTRVFLARDRETQRAKGFAFISFADRTDASRACEKMDGCTFFPPLLFQPGLFGIIFTNEQNPSWLPPPYSAGGIRQADLIFVFSLWASTVYEFVLMMIPCDLPRSGWSDRKALFLSQRR